MVVELKDTLYIISLTGTTVFLLLKKTLGEKKMVGNNAGTIITNSCYPLVTLRILSIPKIIPYLSAALCEALSSLVKQTHKDKF